MPLLRKAEVLRRPVLAPTLGVDYANPSTFLNYRNGFPSNMRIQQGDMKKREGATTIGGSAISGANGVIHLGIFPMNTETIKLLRMSKTKVEVYNTSTLVFDDITGSALGGGDTDFFDDTVAEDTYIFTQLVNNIRKWTGTGNTALLGGNPPKCRYISYLSPYLVAGYLDLGVGRHQKVQWTNTGNIEDWSAGNAGSAVLNKHGGSPLRGIKKLNEVDAAYMKDAIYLGRPVDTSEVIKWDLVEVGNGLLNHRAICEWNGRHYYMALNDFKMFDGVRSESIGTAVRDYVFPRLDMNNYRSHWAIHLKDYEEIWFFVTIVGQSYPTEVWKYNYRSGFWYVDTCLNYRSGVEWYRQASVQWNDLVGTWEQQAQRWDDFLSLSNSPLYIFGTNAGLTHYLDRSTNNDFGNAIDAKYDTIDFIGSKFEQQTRWLQLDFWAKGSGTLKVYYSTEFGINWKSIGTVTLTGEFKRHRLFLDVLSENIRFRFLNNATGEVFYLRQLYPYYLDREQEPV